MSTISITLSEPLREFVTKQAAEQGLDAPNEYIEKLVEKDQQRKIDEYHWKLVQEGLASGQPIPMDENFWRDIHEEIQHRRESRKRQSEGKI